MNWKGIVKTVAPALGTALGGPLAGAAVKEIGDKWLGNPNADESQIEQAVLNASPEQLAQLKKIDADFKVRMRELDLDVDRLAVEDRKSARELFAINIWPQISLSVAFVVGYFASLGLMLLSDIQIDQSLESAFNIILGVITAAMSQIIQFWFGSSLGSKEKTQQLGKLK